MPHNFSWIFEGRLAGMGQPGCGLELTPEMMSHERRFLAWLQSSSSLTSNRQKLAKWAGFRSMGEMDMDRRMLEMYRKFRDVWGVLKAYREGFGEKGEPVDRFELNPERFLADLKFLQQQGIDTIISLTESPLNDEALAGFNFEALHMPIPDQYAPSQEQVDEFLAYVDQKLVEKHSVLVHCLGGYGRTGTMLACYLVHCGMPAAEAIEGIREKRPGSIQTEVQEEAIYEFEERSK